MKFLQLHQTCALRFRSGRIFKLSKKLSRNSRKNRHLYSKIKTIVLFFILVNKIQFFLFYDLFCAKSKFISKIFIFIKQKIIDKHQEIIMTVSSSSSSLSFSSGSSSSSSFSLILSFIFKLLKPSIMKT
jgi:hypothetical protein